MKFTFDDRVQVGTGMRHTRVCSSCTVAHASHHPRSVVMCSPAHESEDKEVKADTEVMADPAETFSWKDVLKDVLRLRNGGMLSEGIHQKTMRPILQLNFEYRECAQIGCTCHRRSSLSASFAKARSNFATPSVEEYLRGGNKIPAGSGPFD